MLSNFFLRSSNKIANRLGWRVEPRNGQVIARPTFVVSVTTRCNFNCPHCLREFVDENKGLIKDLKPSVFEIVLREGKKIGFSNISFTGGEPILNPYFAELVALTTKYGYHYNFISNGWFYDKYWNVIKNNRQNLEVAILSIDGATAEVHDSVRLKSGSFNKIIQAAKFFRENGVSMSATFVITRKNIHHIEPVLELCLELGIFSIKYAAIVDLDGKNDCALNDNDRKIALTKVRKLENKYRGVVAFTFTANLISRESFQKNISTSSFCSVLEGKQLYIDHDGAMIFCCDIYKKCLQKPLIEKIGFEKCLRVNLDVVNELKKKHSHDALNNSLPNLPNFCDFCNAYVENYFDSVKRNQDN